MNMTSLIASASWPVRHQPFSFGTDHDGACFSKKETKVRHSNHITFKRTVQSNLAACFSSLFSFDRNRLDYERVPCKAGEHASR